MFLQKAKNYFYHLPKAIFANLYFRFPSSKMTLVGITGTNGKTTTTSLIHHLLTESGEKTGIISTIFAAIGRQEQPTGLHVTTPRPFALQRIIKQMAENQAKYLALEVSSHGLDQFRTWGCKFAIGVITNVTHEHLDYHQTWQEYLKAKAKVLVAAQKAAIINFDDRSYGPLLKIVKPKNKIISYGLNKKADYYAKNIKQTKEGLSFLVCDNKTKQQFAVRTKLVGEFNVYNCLAAITACRQLGISQKKIIKGLRTFNSPKGRMEFIENNLKIKIIIDFACTPNGLSVVLPIAKQLANGKRLITVFGSAGLRDKSKRPLMGKVASEIADVVVLTAEDPRTESVDAIINQIASGFIKPIKLYKIPDRQKAINKAIREIANPDDVVIICGKGHEQSMCFGKKEIPWSDHKAVKRALSATVK